MRFRSTLKENRHLIYTVYSTKYTRVFLLDSQDQWVYCIPSQSNIAGKEEADKGAFLMDTLEVFLFRPFQ